MAAIGIIGGIFGFLGAIASANAAQRQAQAMEYQAQAERQAADYKAKQEERAAQEDRAAGQRKALDTKEQEKLVQSKLQATAAASGGGAGANDPTVMTLSSDIAQRGEYSALSQMWSGESQAVGLENQAGLDRYVGYTRANALDQEAAATRDKGDAAILGGIGGLFGSFAKFG